MINGRYKRTLDELITLYELEPTLKDIFVEGKRDKAVIKFFLKNLNLKKIEVKLIEEIILPTNKKQDLPLNVHGNKFDVVYLAYKLNERMPEKFNIFCIADTDFDEYISTKLSYPNLFYTDYTCMDMYLFNEDIIHDFFIFHLKDMTKEPGKFIQEIAVLLQELFLLRLVNIKYRYNLSWIDFRNSLKFENNILKIDIDSFLKSILSKNRKSLLFSKIKSQINSTRKLLSTDPRNQIFKKDFLDLFYHYYNNIISGRRYRIKNRFIDGFYCCIKINILAQESLFKEIKKWTED